jgi:hypothetical protein
VIRKPSLRSRIASGWAVASLRTRVALVLTTVVTILLIAGATPFVAGALRGHLVGAQVRQSQVASGAGGSGAVAGTSCTANASSVSAGYATYEPPAYSTPTQSGGSTTVAPPYATYTAPPYSTYTAPPYSTYTTPPYSTETAPPYSTYVPGYATPESPSYSTPAGPSSGQRC